MRAARWISTRTDRAGAAWSPLGEAVRGQSGGVGSVRSNVRRRNITRISINIWTGQPVCELLDTPRGPASGRERESKATGAVTMTILTPGEKEFLDVFLHEATTSPFFKGPATQALYAIGVEYRDISYIAWAYNQEVLRTNFEWGHAAAVAPPLPWTNREAVLRRNREVQRIWERQRKPVGTPKAS